MNRQDSPGIVNLYFSFFIPDIMPETGSDKPVPSGRSVQLLTENCLLKAFDEMGMVVGALSLIV